MVGYSYDFYNSGIVFIMIFYFLFMVFMCFPLMGSLRIHKDFFDHGIVFIMHYFSKPW